jgi:hypothetical protein
LTEDDLERAAEVWIADYFNVRHLIGTRDWLLALEPAAAATLRVAALTHDIERRVPGGPRLDPRQQAWDDPRYLLAHSIRSAQVVGAWLEENDVAPDVRVEVGRLILHHEIGGYPEADLVQAADSLSFLDVNALRARQWVAEGRCDLRQAQAKLDWMRDRIAVARARAPAERLHAAATAALHEGSAPASPARIHSASLSEDGSAQRHERRRPGIHRDP